MVLPSVCVGLFCSYGVTGMQDMVSIFDVVARFLCRVHIILLTFLETVSCGSHRYRASENGNFAVGEK